MSKSRWVTGRGEAVGAAIGAAGSARWGRGGRRRRACALSPPRGPAHARSGLRRSCLLPPPPKPFCACAPRAASIRGTWGFARTRPRPGSGTRPAPFLAHARSLETACPAHAHLGFGGWSPGTSEQGGCCQSRGRCRRLGANAWLQSGCRADGGLLGEGCRGARDGVPAGLLQVKVQPGPQSQDLPGGPRSPGACAGALRSATLAPGSCWASPGIPVWCMVHGAWCMVHGTRARPQGRSLMGKTCPRETFIYFFLFY